jgi:hypothetical protein
MTKNCPIGPSKTRALDFKREIPRFAICSVSAIVGIVRSILEIFGESGVSSSTQKRPSAMAKCASVSGLAVAPIVRLLGVGGHL